MLLRWPVVGLVEPAPSTLDPAAGLSVLSSVSNVDEVAQAVGRLVIRLVDPRILVWFRAC